MGPARTDAVWPRPSLHAVANVAVCCATTCICRLQTATALFMPPFQSRFVLGSAPAWEQMGERWFPTFAGVLMVEAAKQIYAGSMVREHDRKRPSLLTDAARIRKIGWFRARSELTASFCSLSLRVPHRAWRPTHPGGNKGGTGVSPVWPGTRARRPCHRSGVNFCLAKQSSNSGGILDCFASLARKHRHREERSDVAIQHTLDCFASLAVTAKFSSKAGRRAAGAELAMTPLFLIGSG